MTKRAGRHLNKRALSLEAFWEQEKDDLFKDIVAKHPRQKGSSDPAIQTLNDINAFFAEHQREPKQDGSFDEKLLARKLHGLRKLSHREDITEADVHGLLHVNASLSEVKEPEPEYIPQLNTSDDDALADSLLGMLSGDNMQGLFDTASLKNAKPKNTQERVGQRTPCSDFSQYIPIFNQIKEIIDTKKDAIRPFKGTAKINVGDVFIWGGISCFVEQEIKMEYDSQGKPNPRFKIIFDNGMYADLLYQSFSQGMYRSPGTRRLNINVADRLGDLSKSLEQRYGSKTGEIYFLASHSTNPEITKFNHLLKVGVTSNTTPLRTRNADSDSTYLYAPVRILKILPCYNLNVQGLEALIHAKLNEYRKEINIVHKKTGKAVVAREWFDVELNHAVSVALDLVRKNLGDVTLDDNDNLFKS